MARKIQAPGTEINEIDFSQYADLNDNSIVGTTAFVMGFADHGMDYATKYVNSMATYRKMFGVPTNEAETYLYNASNEIINRGGNVYVSKLPYDNFVLDKYAYTDYTVENNMVILSSPYDIVTHDFGCLSIHYYDFIMKPDIDTSVLVDLITEKNNYDIETESELNEIIVDVEQTDMNLLQFFDDISVHLSVIGDFVDFVIDECMFDEEQKILIDSVLNENGKRKNCSTYILSCLHDDYHMIPQITNVESLFIEQNKEEFNTIRERLNVFGDFENKLYKFGNTPKKKYFRDYLHNLLDVLESKRENNEIIVTFITCILKAYDNEIFDITHTEIKHVDNTLTSMINIKSNGFDKSGLMTMDDLDNLRTNQMKLLPGTIRMVDVTRSKYKHEYNILNKENPMEYIGVLPVITTPMNAMYYQQLIQNSDDDFMEYTALSSIKNIKSDNKFYDETTKTESKINCTMEQLNNDTNGIAGFTYNMGVEKNTDLQQITTSKMAASYFPELLFVNEQIDRKHIKDIGVVVFNMEIDRSQEYKVLLTPVESYVGSLNRKEIDNETKANKFIDDIVNNNSTRINLFSNIRFSPNAEVPMTINDRTSTFAINNQQATSLGFYSKDCLKNISVKESIIKAIDRIFGNNEDINKVEIDMVVDAGVSNIAQFISQVYPLTGRGYYDLGSDNASLFRLNDYKDAKIWANILQKYDTFCKNIRKDCMFLADGLRSLCLNEDEKTVRNTKPSNTINNTILKNIKYMSGHVNSSYGAGYSDWFLSLNAYNNDVFWCPPSIKAAGLYIYSDAYYNYWSAPAGMNRGRLQTDVFDVAFSPTLEQAGVIYNNNWNYAVNYPIDGIIMEGQRTFQRNKTAFDRVNVRRLFLGLEKQVRYIAKYFKYDGITDYMMMRFSDLVSNLLEDVKNKGGINEYYVVCDRRNNTAQTIDNNELHCTIAIKPVKALEFIVLNYICSNQSVDVQELAEGQL